MDLKVKNPLITLYGSNYVNNEWTVPCMESWKNIINLSAEDFYVLPDKALSGKEATVLSDLQFKLLGKEHDRLVETFLKDYPSLKFIREKDLTWKKVLDIAILFNESEKITIIDTDVYVKDKVYLPLEGYDLAYMREDIPAYRGKWKMVWKEKMVPALNAGIIIVNPEIVDFDYLENIAAKYLINCKDFWWTEQSAWSCIAGKSGKRLLFSGKQVRVTSGTRKRTAPEITQNLYRYFGKKGMITNFKEFEPLLSGGSIFHFAGPGKYMFQNSLNFLTTSITDSTVSIIGEYENTLSFRDKIWISLRLFLKESF